MSDIITVDRAADGVAVVRINRPEARNALNMAVRRRLAELFRGFAEDEALRCVVLTGNEKVFAAGADIRDMVDASAIDMYLRHSERLWGAIADCPVPLIAAINGYALGGGLELALHADIIVAGRGAQLGQPEVKVGIMPGAGGTQRLTRAVGKYHAMRLTLTGEMIGADEAFAMGLVSKVVEDHAVLDEALAMARHIAGLPPIAVAQIKEAVIHGEDASLAAGLMLERKALQLLFATADKKEGMQAFLEKRSPRYSGR
ncbi:MAG TPA: enoyl-CoA hydratase-related protein [Alphaproteobacteria bacterium]|nr:enoyl-CoA hydratase-related protein [Alphaproteobacteria bacterium]